MRVPVSDIEGVASVTVPAPGMEPGAFFRWAAGRPRGFWARGEHWVAHAGVITGLALDAGGEGPGRFDEVWKRGSALLGKVRALESAPGLASRTPRLYGGFSFRTDDARSEPCWHRFPSASFVLPEVEVVGEGAEATLTLRERREPGAGGASAPLGQRARRLLEELRSVSAVREDVVGRAELLPHESSRHAWSGAVDEAIDWIRRGRVSKVVLARILDVAVPGVVDPARVALALWHDNPGTHVFLYEPTEGAAVVGAAPETVATVEDGVFRATAVAGSISRGEAPEEQEALALKLLESEKDREEHAIAVDDMIRRLRPLSDELSWDSEPHVLTLSRIQHLETRIKARLASDQTVLSALAELHPTPAVCGLPRDPALEFLRMEEPFDRGWYAGPVGWFDAAGDGVFAPALRSGVREGDRWRLFAGAGIVAASDPELEWEETRIKFEPMLRALEAAGLRRGEAG